MAKVNDLKKGLGKLKKKAIITTDKGEEIISKIHANENKVVSENKPSKKRGRRKLKTEKTVRYTIDFPESFYKEMKHFLVEDGGTMKAFIMKAVKKELKNK